jgi:hypothetical protein
VAIPESDSDNSDILESSVSVKSSDTKPERFANDSHIGAWRKKKPAAILSSDSENNDDEMFKNARPKIVQQSDDEEVSEDDDVGNSSEEEDSGDQHDDEDGNSYEEEDEEGSEDDNYVPKLKDKIIFLDSSEEEFVNSNESRPTNHEEEDEEGSEDDNEVPKLKDKIISLDSSEEEFFDSNESRPTNQEEEDPNEGVEDDDFSPEIRRDDSREVIVLDDSSDDDKENVAEKPTTVKDIGLMRDQFSVLKKTITKREEYLKINAKQMMDGGKSVREEITAMEDKHSLLLAKILHGQDVLKQNMPKKAELPAQKKYSALEVFDLEAQLKKSNNMIETNEKLLRSNRARLPDDGAQLICYIEGLKTTQAECKAKLDNARKNKAAPSNPTFGAAGSSGVVVNDEQKLDMLHKKVRVLRQNYSITRPDKLHDGGASLRKEIEICNKQIVELDAVVKRSNPNYRPPMPGSLRQTPIDQINGKRSVVVLEDLPGKLFFID